MTETSINRRLRIIQFTYLAALASFINYLALYLDSIGFSEFRIGVIHAVGAIVMLIIQPLLGRVLDRTQNFCQIVSVVLIACVLGVAAVPVLGSLIWLELILIILLYAIIKQFGGVFDLWTYQLKSDHPGISYGSTRGVGSIGEGLATFIVGYLIAWFGFAPMFILTIVCFMLTLLAAARMPNPRPAPQTDSAGQEAPRAQPDGVRARMQSIWSRRLVLYVASFLMVKVAVTLISTFCSLMVKRLGAGSEWYGFIILLCGIAELPVFMLLGRWCQGPRVRPGYLLCMGLGLLGSLMTALAQGLAVFVVGRIMLTIVYAMYTVINLEYVNQYVDASRRGQVILVIGAVSSGVSYIASSLLGGYLLELGSQSLMALVLTGLFVAALVLQTGAFGKKGEVNERES